MSFRRFRRSQSVRQTGLPFTDVGDFIPTNFSPPGAANFPANPEGLPRGGVRRLMELDGEPSFPRFGVKGQSPFASSQSFPRLRLSVRASPVVRIGTRAPSPLMQAQRRLDWRAFRLLAVRSPSRVGFCVRRQQRREVLFAKGIGGRRGLVGRGGSYHRTENSQWRC